MAITSYLLRINSTDLPKVKTYKVLRSKLWTDAGRNMAGELRSTFLGIYPKITVEFAHTTEDEQQGIIQLLDNASFNLAWYDAKTKGIKAGKYYAGDYESAVFDKRKGLYAPFSVSLIPFKKMT